MAMLTTSIYIEPLNVIKISWPLMCRGVCRGWVMRVSLRTLLSSYQHPVTCAAEV